MGLILTLAFDLVFDLDLREACVQKSVAREGLARNLPEEVSGNLSRATHSTDLGVDFDLGLYSKTEDRRPKLHLDR